MSGNFYCTQCGSANTEGAQFCTNCGAATQAARPAMTAPAAAPAPMAANPYQPVQVAPFAGIAPRGGVRYGGFWIRFVAAIIDAVIVQAVVMPISFVIGGITGAAGALGGGSNVGLSILGGLFGAVVGIAGTWLYEALMTSSARQATLGKMIFGMRVTDLNGNRISFGRATGRYFAKWISAFTLLIGYLVAGFTERKQALHDMIAGTLVRIG